MTNSVELDRYSHRTTTLALNCLKLNAPGSVVMAGLLQGWKRASELAGAGKLHLNSTLAAYSPDDPNQDIRHNRDYLRNAITAPRVEMTG